MIWFRRFEAILSKLGSIFLCWYGLVNGVEWAANLFRFLAVLGGLVGILYFFVPNKYWTSTRTKGRSLPVFISVPFDIIVICICAAQGAFVMAILVLASLLGKEKVHGLDENDDLPREPEVTR